MITVGFFLVLLALAFACEYLDASIGMGYGTILAPLMVIMGFDPMLAVPAILLSQAAGGISASIFHSKFDNLDVSPGSKDMKAFCLISGGGVLATILAAIIAVNIPKNAMSVYIGVLVAIMGLLVLRNKPFRYSWKKVVGIGILSAFNKGLSGGGYGPVVTGGQLLAGNSMRSSVGVTTMSEPPICIAGFLAYASALAVRDSDKTILNVPFAEFLNKAGSVFQWEVLLALFMGAVMAAPIAAYSTKVFDGGRMMKVVGWLMLVLGIGTLFRVWNS